ncbi:MAG: plasmid replication, integration and excision activator [Streptosporangiaceae bacterium]
MALRNGSRLHVSMQDVFPHGCHLVPESIVEAQDYDENTGRRSPAVDKHTGQRVFSCRVMDMDPELEGRSRETVVKILSDRMPVPPTRAPFEMVEFEGLQVTPYVDTGRCQGRGRCGARMAFSLRATGMKAASRPVAKDAA